MNTFGSRRMSLEREGRDMRPAPTRPFSDTAPPGRNLCSCCPYGYHIDTDFIRYCETLINELNQCANSVNRYGSPSHGNYGNHRSAQLDDPERDQDLMMLSESAPSNFQRSNSLQYRRRAPHLQRSASTERSHPHQQSYYDHDYLNGNYIHRYSDTEQPFSRSTHNPYTRHSPMIPSAVNPPPSMSQSYHHYGQDDIDRRQFLPGVNKSRSSSTLPRYLNVWPLPPSPSAKYDHDANTWYEAVRRFDQVCLEHQESLRRRMKRRIGGMNSGPTTLGSMMSSTASTLSPSVASSSSDTASLKSTKSQASSSFDSHIPPAATGTTAAMSHAQSPLKFSPTQPTKSIASPLASPLTSTAASLAAGISSTNSMAGIGGSRFSPTVCNTIIQQIHTQIQSNMDRVKELENQVKSIPLLRQQLILATKEKKKMEKLCGTGLSGPQTKADKSTDLTLDAKNREEFSSRIAQLERSGLITPPLCRRKSLLLTGQSPNDGGEDEDDGAMSDRTNYDEKIDEYFADTWYNLQPSPSPIALTPVDGRSSAAMNKSSSTPVKSQLLSSSRCGSGAETVKRRLSLQSGESISIEPNSQTRLSNATDAIRRSVGVSTNSLSAYNTVNRRHALVGTDLHGDDVVSRKELNCERRAMISWGTDPIPIDVNHAWVQVTPSRTSVGLKTDATPTKSTGINPIPPSDCTRSIITQTETIRLCDREVQIDEEESSLSKELRTVGVGDDSIHEPSSEKHHEPSLNARDTHPEVQAATGHGSSRPNSASSFSMVLCDKCNERVPVSATQQSAALPQQLRPQSQSGDSGSDARSSPSASGPSGSRIPRLTSSPQGVIKSSSSGSGIVEKRLSADRKLVIQEKENEILVYSNLGLDLDEDVEDLEEERTEKLCPPPIRPKRKEYNQEDIDKICTLISESEDESDDEDDSKDSSSDSEGTYDCVRAKATQGSSAADRAPVAEAIKEVQEPSKEMRAALKVLNDHLTRPERFSKSSIASCLSIIEKEWFRVSALDNSDPATVEAYLDCFESYSKHVLDKVVNLPDSKAQNTGLHYAISHANFDVVSVLLDSKVCDVNRVNQAGYTPIMLVSLVKVENEVEKSVIRKLFQLGDVNVKAQSNGQTALMLAASHGKFVQCKLLLESGAEVNLQDNDGSTALMCAVEHGNEDVVRLLLSHPDCDPSIADNDGATALSIAMASNRKDIGLMLYAATNMLSRGSSAYASLRKSQSKAITKTLGLRRTGSFSGRRAEITHKTFQLAPSPPRSRRTSISSVQSAKSTRSSRR